MAKGGELLSDPPALELIRREAEVAISVTRWCERLGIPRSTYYHRLRRARQGPVGKGPWPAPTVGAIEDAAALYATDWAAWGHRKVWAMMRADGYHMSQSSILRALRRRGLVQPVDYQRQRRELARARKKRFLDPPARRNRVWQMDFSEFETLSGGIWRLCAVVDYATKICLACRVATTQTHRDAIVALDQARGRAAELLDLEALREDCVDRDTGEIAALVVVSDNGSAFKSSGFARYVAGHGDSATCAPATRRRRPTGSWSASSSR